MRRVPAGLAERDPHWNHLGVEIRRPLVTSADQDALASEHGNVRILFCNANISLEGWMKALKQDRLQRVSIQFPIPGSNERTTSAGSCSRRFCSPLQPPSQPGRELFLQSDVLDVIEPMVALTELSACLTAPPRTNVPGAPATRFRFPRNGSATCLSKTSPSTGCSIAGTRIHFLPCQIWNSAGKRSIIRRKHSPPEAPRWPLRMQPRRQTVGPCWCAGRG